MYGALWVICSKEMAQNCKRHCLTHTSNATTANVSEPSMRWKFADRVHVNNHLILVQALAHTLVPNYDMPYALYCDRFDRGFVKKKAGPS